MELFNKDGFKLFNKQLTPDQIDSIKTELTDLSNKIEQQQRFNDANEFWNWCKTNNREKGGILYNGFKHLSSVHRIASSNQITSALSSVGINSPALIDINCRIDSQGEEQYLFGWHQDYWFSISSPNAVVVWIPLNEIDPSLGGLDIISNEYTHGKIFKTTSGNKYNSYADAVLLDEPIPIDQAITINKMAAGDVLIFKFSLLHKSNPVSSPNKSRFTIQLRFADFDDPEFFHNKYKPGVVIPGKIDYLIKDIRV